MKTGVTVNTGAAAHVMLEALVPNMKLEHTGALKNFVAVHGERIRDMGEKTSPFKTSEGAEICTVSDPILVPCCICLRLFFL